MKKLILVIASTVIYSIAGAETINENLVVNGRLQLTGEPGNGGDSAIRIDSDFTPVTTDGSRYYRTLSVNPSNYNIPSGVTDNGYRIGITADSFANSSDFQGILYRQVGAWLRVGHYSHPTYGNPTGRINNSIALWLENLDSGGMTIDNSYGLYQTTASSKNYFAGDVGIGTTAPSDLVHLHSNGDTNLRLSTPGGIYTKLNQDGSRFRFHSESHPNILTLVNGNGFVGIGTISPQHELAVNGTIQAKEVIVETGWSDFVFEDSYRLRSLDEVESHIEEHGHLPDVPSAAIVESEGLSVGEAQKIMMQKIEELTLYMIDLKKENKALKLRVAELETN